MNIKRENHLSNEELLNQQPPEGLEVSCLYSLEPIQIGTPFVESLTGYISRLAFAHCVPTGTLVSKKLAPLSARESKELNGICGRFGRAVNGGGAMAFDAVQALEKLTFRHDFLSLTLLNYSDWLHNWKLLRLHKAWCPLCYNEWSVKKQIIYNPLLWCFEIIQVCPIHQRALVDHCPNCGATSFPLTWFSRPGYCSRCQQWLGRDISIEQSSDYQIQPTDELEWQLFVGNSIGRLLSSSFAAKSTDNKNRLRANLHSLLNQVADGNIAKFAKLVFLDDSRLFSFFSERNQLSIEALLKICFHLRIDFPNLILSEASETEKPRASSKFEMVEHQCQVNSAKFTPEVISNIRSELDRILMAPEKPPSNKVVCSILRISYESLRKYFPNYCDAISKKRSEYPVAAFIAYRLEEVRSRLKEILIANTQPSSISQIALELETDKPTLEEYFPDLCSLINLRRSEGKKPIHASEKDINLEAYLKSLLSSRDCPPSLTDISQKFEVGESDLLEEFPDLVFEISSRRAQYSRVAEIDKNHKVFLLLKEELSKPESEACSINEFCKLYSLHSQTLEKNFPQEYKALVMRSNHIRNVRSSENIAQVNQEVYQAVILLNSKGIYPSLGQVRKYLRKPRYMQDPRIIATWKSALKELNLLK